MKYETPKDYSEASHRLQAILEKLKDDSCSIDLLAEYVEEAGLLIAYCKEKLADTGIKITSILESIKDPQTEIKSGSLEDEPF